MPWTPEGFGRAVELGRPKALRWHDLTRASRLWWGRNFPRGEVEAKAVGSAEDDDPQSARIRKQLAEAADPFLMANALADALQIAGQPLPDVLKEALANPSPAPEERQRDTTGPTSAQPRSQTATRFFEALGALEEEDRKRIQRDAASPEGYARLLTALESLAEFRSPADIVENFPSELREFVENYVTRERKGQGADEPWALEDFLSQLDAQMTDTDYLHAATEVGRDGQGRLFIEGMAIRGDEATGYYVMRDDSGGASRRYIRLLDDFDPYSEALRFENIEHARNEGKPLATGDYLYRDEPGLEDDEIRDTWAVFQELAETLRAAPAALDQARELLVVARELIESPRCQGNAKTEALRALKAASGHYFDAARRLREGAHGAVYANLRRVSRFLALQSQRIAESCSLGQASLGLGGTLDMSNVSDATLADADAHFDAENEEQE